MTWDLQTAQELYDGTLSYVYGMGAISEVDATGTTFYYLPHGLGSTMALCDANGNVVDSYNYDAFGAVRSTSGTQANPFTFTGEQTDASTGLEYLRARYYDPATGSFISRDPVPGINRFAYADGDPINYTDPSGMCLSKDFLNYMRGFLDRLEAGLGSGKIADFIREQWEKAFAAARTLACTVEKYTGKCLASIVCTTLVTMFATGGFEDLAMLGGEEAFGAEEAAAAAGAEEAAAASKTGEQLGQEMARAGPGSGWEPGPGWEWKGKPPAGGPDGQWYNQGADERLHPHWNSPSHGPHVDYGGPKPVKPQSRIYPDGRVEPKR